MRDRLPMIFSTTALVVAVMGATPLGEAAYNAVAPGSVGTAQLKNNSITAAKLRKGAVTNAKLRGDAVTSGKVKNRSLRAIDFKLGQLPAGPPGPKGDKGDKGDKGAQGSQGPGIDYAKGYRESKFENIPKNTNFEILANCKPGDIPVAGSFRTGVPLSVSFAGTLFFPNAAGSSTEVAGRYVLRGRNNTGSTWSVTAEVDCAPIIKAP